MKRSAVILSALIFISSPVLAAETTDQARLQSALEKGLKAYESVRDYKAVFQKQERSGAVLGPKETIFLKFEKPFKIFLGWMNTHKKGLQVLYERGKRDGKLAIHKPGLLLGLAPVVYLEQDSPWVREGSESYDIEDAGIGTFLQDLAAAVSKGANENKLKVGSVKEDATGETMDVLFTGSREGDGFFAYHIIVHFDRETSLPDRMQLFDWQDQPMGNYAYEDLKLNVGADDAEFKQLAQRKLYSLFLPAQLPVTAKPSNFARTQR